MSRVSCVHLARYQTSGSCCCCCCCCLRVQVCQCQYKRGGAHRCQRLRSFPPFHHHRRRWWCPFQRRGCLHNRRVCWGLRSLAAVLLPLRLLIGLVAARHRWCLCRCWEMNWRRDVGIRQRREAKRQGCRCGIAREDGDCGGVG